MVNADKMVKVFSETVSHKLIHGPWRAGLVFNEDERKIVFQSLFMSIPATCTFPKKRNSLIQPAAASMVPRVSLEHQSHSTEMWNSKEK